MKECQRQEKDMSMILSVHAHCNNHTKFDVLDGERKKGRCYFSDIFNHLTTGQLGLGQQN